MEDHNATDPPLRTLNVFYQGTNMEMLEETYLKFKKNILLKMKKTEPNFQEIVIEYCEPDQVIDICSYNHYPVLDKSSQEQEQLNDSNDICGGFRALAAVSPGHLATVVKSHRTWIPTLHFHPPA